MTTISVREFAHHMAKYLKMLKEGEGFILKYHNEPIAHVLPSNSSIPVLPGWRRQIKKVQIKGGPISETIVEMRKGERR